MNTMHERKPNRHRLIARIRPSLHAMVCLVLGALIITGCQTPNHQQPSTGQGRTERPVARPAPNVAQNPRSPTGAQANVEVLAAALASQLASADLRQLISNRLERAARLLATLNDIDAAIATTVENVRNTETIAFKKVAPVFEQGRLVKSSRVLTAGELIQTGERLDLAIQGPGFFRIGLPGGGSAYTRAGAFQSSSDGTMVSRQGHKLLDLNPVTNSATSVEVSRHGEMKVSSANGAAVFSIVLASFPNPSGLAVNEEGLFLETAASGSPELGRPGSEPGRFGEIAQGYLEASNANAVEESVRLRALLSWKRQIEEALLSPSDR